MLRSARIVRLTTLLLPVALPWALLSVDCTGSVALTAPPSGGDGAGADAPASSNGDGAPSTDDGAPSTDAAVAAADDGAADGAQGLGGRDASSAGETTDQGDAGGDGSTSDAGEASVVVPDAAAPIGPAPVHLGAAGNYVILAKSAITNVPTSAITGDLGLSPAAATYITGFAMTRRGTKWTAPQVTGSLFAADNDPPTPTALTTAIGDMQTAYTDAAGRPTPTFLNKGAGSIGGLTLTPGLYKWTTSVTVPLDVQISGGPSDTWIFQITGDLMVSAAKNMTLIGGARAKNIVWQVAGSVQLGTSSHAAGIVLSQTAITLATGASIDGRLYAQTAVNTAGATVTAPAP